MTESFYDVLGVAEDATTDEIETAYRERLKETHPDVSESDDAEQETKVLIEARDVLVDEDERERYDRLGHDAYVGDGTPTASDTAAGGNDAAADASTAETEEDDRTSATGGERTQSRGRREQRARERVREERRRAREARQKRRETDRNDRH